MQTTRQSLADFAPRARRQSEVDAIPKSGVLRALASFAAQDWLVASYLLVLLTSVVLGHGARRDHAITCLLVDALVFFTCMLVSRTAWESRAARIAAGLLYRVGLIGVVVASFLQLHFILPSVSDRVLDARIYALDLRLFGVEPAQAFDRFVTPATTEWFSFFYYSYFFILCAYLVPMALFERRMRVLSELSFGLLFVVCVGHCLYLVVPGLGPYAYLKGQFTHELSGGFWWPIVKHAVASVDGASRKDIFPSLHTACPTFLTLFTFRNRAHRPYRYLWPVIGFFTINIILATMFLRWHYLVDVLAGLTLAGSAFALSRVVVPAERRSRSELGLGPVWEPLFKSAR